MRKIPFLLVVFLLAFPSTVLFVWLVSLFIPKGNLYYDWIALVFALLANFFIVLYGKLVLQGYTVWLRKKYGM